MALQLLTPLKDAHEFKPLLAEIEERPTSPTGRMVLWILLAFITAAMAWMCFAEIDVSVGDSSEQRRLHTGNC